jgi:hypothetical protein
LTGSVTFGAADNSVTIDVVPVDDALAEPAETVALTLRGSNRCALGTKSASLTIADNEPSVSIVAGKNASEIDAQARTLALGGQHSAQEFEAELLAAGTGVGTFTLTRTTVGAPLTVNLLRSGTAVSKRDYVLKKGDTVLESTVTFDASESTITLSVVPVSDLLADPAGGKTVILTVASSPGYLRGSASASRWILDDEPRVGIASTKNASETDPTGSGRGYFMIERSTIGSPLTVNYSTRLSSATPGRDYVLMQDGMVLSGSFTFGAADKTVRLDVVPVADGLEELPESVVFWFRDSRFYLGGLSNQVFIYP